jgi:hypothetical protein
MFPPALPQSFSVRAAAPPPAPRLHPNLAEVYRRKVADLQTALADPKTQTEALEILRGLIERVVLHPASGNLFLLINAYCVAIQVGSLGPSYRVSGLSIGTEIVESYGYDPTGMTLREFPHPPVDGAWLPLYLKVIEGKLPVFGRYVAEIGRDEIFRSRCRCPKTAGRSIG